MEIRAATLGDYEDLNDLFKDADRLHHTAVPRVFKGEEGSGRSREFIEEVLEDAASAILVATRDDEVLGFIHMQVQNRPELGPLYERSNLDVSALVVREGLRGLGIGRALLEKGLAWGKELGLSGAELTVWSFNEDSVRFYERMGFEMMTHRMRKELD